MVSVDAAALEQVDWDDLECELVDWLKHKLGYDYTRAIDAGRGQQVADDILRLGEGE